MQTRNRWLLVVMASSFPAIVWGLAGRKDEGMAGLLGSAVGQIGTLLLIWLQILGFRGLVGRLFPDWLWVSRLHRCLAVGAVLFIACHPVLMAAASDELAWSFLFGGWGDPEQMYLTLGKLALAIMVFTWVVSAMLRGRLPFRFWKRLHLVNYLVLPLVLLHSLNVGSSLEEGPMRALWYVLGGIVATLFVSRAIYHAAGHAAYVVTRVASVTHDTTRITFSPRSRALLPAPGQFVYLQMRRFGEAHPFTVSHFDERSRAVSITAKRLGPFTHGLGRLRPGDIAFLDGPYGVFTREAHATEKPIVLVAGGIGITPFLSLLASWCGGARAADERAVTLFYGNKTISDIAYREDLERLSAAIPNGRIVHVLSQAAGSDAGGTVEHGYVDDRMLRKHLDGPLCGYEYFVCGPPPMMAAVVGLLDRLGAPRHTVHTERFAV